jgi:hypothetical protein
MKSFFARLVQTLSGREAAPPKTRLTSEEAVEIASAYARTHSLDLPHVSLVPEEVREVDGKLVWTLRTPTRGRWLTVGVDDATGEVVGHHVHGVR